MSKGKRYFLVAGCLFITCVSCFNPFAPELTRSLESVDLIVTQQQSPEEVLQNFKVAYIFRDSLLYSDLLDTAFVFAYYDPEAGTSGQIVSWNRDTDLRATGRLFRHFHVIDLIWNSTISENINENTGEVSKQFDLTLVSNETDYHVTGRAVFSFRRCWDNRWRITHWDDVSEL